MPASSALIGSAVVRGDDIAVTEDNWKAKRQRAAKRFGEGVCLTVRIEPEADAIKYAQLKHLYGHLYTPVSARTGETVADVHVRLKMANFPDDGRTSLTELNREELKAYIESVEQDIRETDPDSWDDCLAAMALYEQSAGRQRRMA